ncbi:unnamed protein product [Ectocarpus sp. 12 AP-2014]
MLKRNGWLSVAGALLLVGCQSQEKEAEVARPLIYQPIEKHYVAPACSAEKCTEVQIDALEFPQSPALTEQLRQRLLGLAAGVTEGSSDPVEDWDAYAQDFFTMAEEDQRILPEFMASEAQMKARVYAQHNDLLIIELTSYVYHAGQAHGLPMTQFMVIDERDHHVVSFDDMIKSGQESAFQSALSQAHQRWIVELEQDEQFVSHWPLSESRNVAPTAQGWVVKYNVYDIAPYAVGQPELLIRNEALADIAEPRYLNL